MRADLARFDFAGAPHFPKMDPDGLTRPLADAAMDVSDVTPLIIELFYNFVFYGHAASSHFWSRFFHLSNSTFA